MKITTVLVTLLLSVAASALEVGDVAPCADLQHLNVVSAQTTYSACAADQGKEGQPVLIEFFQTTCHYCQLNLPVLKALADETANGLTVRQVGIDRNPELLVKYVADNAGQLPGSVAVDSLRVLTKLYKVTGTPEMYVIGKDNKIIYKHVGSLDQDAVLEIKKLVQPTR
ncbi:MAG: TlpA family protein disulfide reductase [Bdellovibrionota bacterium]